VCKNLFEERNGIKKSTMHRTMDGQGKSVQHRAPGAHLAVPFPHRGTKGPNVYAIILPAHIGPLCVDMAAIARILRFCCRAAASIPDRRLLPSPKCNHCNRFCTISNAQDSRQVVLGVARDALKQNVVKCKGFIEQKTIN